MLPMYPGMANSPKTTIVSAIGASETTITIDDADKLPAAPNLAVIGTGEDCETIVYTVKSGAVLSGITRGAQGNAQMWPGGTVIARNFTAYDYDALRQNLDGLTPADINATRPNLLDNWYFAAPVNQRGVSGAVSAPGYFIDRWILVSGTVELTANGLLLNGEIRQPLERSIGTPTFASIKMHSGAATASYDDNIKSFSVISSGGVVEAAKLEVGDSSTSEDDAPPKPGAELAECQRYQIVFSGYQFLGFGIAESNGYVQFSIPTPVTLRAHPIVRFLSGNIKFFSPTEGIFDGVIDHTGVVGTSTVKVGALFEGLPGDTPGSLWIDDGAILVLDANI